MDRLLSMRVFERVIDEGGFAAAARALDLSPAGVTRLVADLETHLGTRLLHRNTRRLSLSDAGEAYLSRVRGILRDIDDADEVASAHTHELSGVLRLLAPPVLASHILSPLVAGFRQLYPKIQLDVEVATFKEPPVEDYDITLFGAPDGYDGDIIARKVVSGEAILVASPAYLKQRGTPQTPADLSSHCCLRLRVAGSSPTEWRLMRGDRPEEPVVIAVTPALLANHTDTLLRATVDGAGITSAPVDLVAANLASGALVRVLPQWITGRFSLYAALPSRQFLPKRSLVFLDYLTEQTQLMVAAALAQCTPAAAPALSGDALQRL
ncbi:LysR family transcriptional regulator [Rhodoferax sp. PAMC 29310]|uniref:LysR family transcriptional regulator n=1 Tax=Rhodoferax sp. PAMC 29310 TaxID=2822760 RepID=UPI001B31A743|nr:LysR family transcriptional regulator [Rhodoferax sp. PAMC 29310]